MEDKIDDRNDDLQSPAGDPELGEQAVASAGTGSDEALVAELRQQVKDSQEKADQYLDQLRRSVADFANYKKRIERENAELQRYATATFTQKLLPVVDDLDRAFANLPGDLEGREWVDGIRLVRQKFMDILAREGVTETAVKPGDYFDPMLHEAVTHEESSKYQDGQIIGVVRKGYRIGDRILRPAQVRVARHVSEQ